MSTNNDQVQGGTVPFPDAENYSPRGELRGLLVHVELNNLRRDVGILSHAYC